MTTNSQPYRILIVLYRMLIVWVSRSRKRNVFLNVIGHQPDIDKFCLHAKDPHEAEYQWLINKSEGANLKHFNYSEVFIEYSNDMNDTYKSIEEYNPNKELKILLAFDDMNADMFSNKKLNAIVAK